MGAEGRCAAPWRSNSPSIWTWRRGQQIFNLLQIRPIIDNQDNRPIDWSEVDTSDALVYGENALGIGMMSDISDVIYIKSGTFSSLSTEKIADELLELNRRMRDEKRSYILVGPGRWGSSDPFLGVTRQVEPHLRSKVIVECGIEKFDVEPSQGTHFFQNVTSLGGLPDDQPLPRRRRIPRRGARQMRRDLRRQLPAAGAFRTSAVGLHRRPLEQRHRQRTPDEAPGKIPHRYNISGERRNQNEFSEKSYLRYNL